MIWEVWQYATTPVALPYVKSMGFLKEVIATAARGKRCQKHWSPHYQACRNSILRAADACPRHRHLLIFGAGSLQDIPLDILSKRFERITLVDLVFLSAARSKAALYPNVCLRERDVSESLVDINAGTLKVCDPVHWLDDPEIDLVVSLNLLTQLPLMPVKWLESHGNFNEHQTEKLGQDLINSHLQYLQKFKAKKDTVVCLIADRWVQRFDCEGQLIKEFDPWWDVPQPVIQQEWDWQVMPLGEASNRYSQIHRVGVTIL
ncbi:MAG: hypothetical protein R3189_04675 [Thiomicrorhabdus chilensis]|uniref:hypothetical protein n=1 Tax=Thiomicrorhabdus chilensis TaxID=63656 RepID=UPI00040FAD80|nr:hypothetical protein [Thiomicrorhabdus chilensis]MDX1347529.1 hypothetical protein [Thiomicrorhabdus chilensis]